MQWGCGTFAVPLFVTLLIPFSRSGTPLFRQIYLGLRQAILSGTLAAGERLPSTRELAEQLGVSRTIVLLAYDHLLAESFVIGKPGSGTFVSTGLQRANSGKQNASSRISLSRFGRSAANAASRVNYPQSKTTSVRYDFAYGRSDIGCFPFEKWRRILMRHARGAPVRELDYGPTAGSPALRDAICTHLRRSRAVVCDPTQVIVVSGSQQALDLIARVLIEPGDRVVIEDPSYQGTREVLRAAGASLLTVTVDHDGLDPAKLPPEGRIAFVTPSHQFPTGVVLPLARRLQLLEWARRRNAVIVEDDYDGEFHYEGRPLESLQGLDGEGRVIYIGTFSRTVYSSLRIGYLVTPKRLVSAFTAAKWLCDRHTATLEQETLAQFISDGMYERHLRHVRRRNARRRHVLLCSIREFLGDRVEVTGDGAGAHIVLWPRHRIAEETTIRRAALNGVGIYGISPYFLKRPTKTGLLLGYSRMTETQIREGIRRLGEIF